MTGKESVKLRKAAKEGGEGGPSVAPRDDGIIYKNGKAYKKRKEMPDLWTMLSEGAPREPGDENKPRKPKRWYDDLVWPWLLFLTFCLSLFIFHIAPHDDSVGRRKNRFTMDNLASGGFAGDGYDQPQQVWGMSGRSSARRDAEDEKGGSKTP